jgi:hypothetical protein
MSNSSFEINGSIIANSGSFIVGSGSAGSPSFEFSGDTDTGMFSPAANTIGLATSGVERLRINNIGNISIGIDSSPHRLAVSGNIHVMGGNIIGNKALVTGSGSVVYYNHPNYSGSSDYDPIIPGELELTRDLAYGIYNKAVESSWVQGVTEGPADTIWNVDGWSNIGNIASRTYNTLLSFGTLGNNIVGPEWIMLHVPSNRYWKVQFGSWTTGGGGGGFEYTRQEIYFNTIINDHLCVRNDGNVGIGTNDPSTTLDVVGNIKTNSNLQINNTSLSESQLINIINGGNLYLWSNFR